MAGRKKVRVFRALRESLADALAYERGAHIDLRVTELPARPRPMKPAEIREIRRALHASQQVFATYLNVSPNAVRSWEQGVRRPQHAALKLLMIARHNPQALLL